MAKKRRPLLKVAPPPTSHGFCGLAGAGSRSVYREVVGMGHLRIRFCVHGPGDAHVSVTAPRGLTEPERLVVQSLIDHELGEMHGVG